MKDFLRGNTTRTSWLACALAVQLLPQTSSAQTSGMVRLGKGEVAEIREPGSEQSGATSILEGSDMAQVWVSPGANITISGAEEGSGSEERIDPAIGKKLGRLGAGETVSVIIQMELPFDKFYEHGQSAGRIADKQARFHEAKARVGSLLRGNGKAKLKGDLQIIGGVSADLDAESLERLSRGSGIKKVELDRTVQAVLDTSPDEIHAQETWAYTDSNNLPLTGAGKRIAIIDTGVDYTHADLGGCLGATCKVIGGYDFVNNDANPMDDQGHGTHVAATAAGNGLLKGIAPDAKILAYKVLNAAGSGPSTAIIAAIQRATDPNNDGSSADHADVASMSLGGAGNPDDSMSRAVDNSVAAGVVHVIAAGNSGPGASTIGSPGTSRTAITVAAACAPHGALRASSCAEPIASFSSRGPLIWNGVDIQKPDISAPGVMICAARWANAFASSPTCFDNAHTRISGTSMATPHMAGAAALIRQAFPAYTPAQIKQLIKTTARSLGMSYNAQGAGMVDLRAAIPGSQKVTSTPSPWNVTTSPTLKLSTIQQAFSVTPTLSTINTLSVSLNLPIPGVSVSFSKTSLQVSNKATDSFTATFTADNDLAKAGSYVGSIVFSEGGVAQGAIPILLKISPTLTASASLIDYGVDNPALTSWASGNKQVTVTNLRSDVAQVVAISSPAYPAGVTFQSPATLTIPAGATALLDTSLSVNNAVVPNAIYNGFVSLNNPANSLQLSSKFVKYFMLTVSETNPSDPHYYIVAHDRLQTSYLTNFSASANFYFSTPGPYDVIVSYKGLTDASGFHLSTVFKEGLLPSQGAAAVSVSRSDAKYSLKTIPTDYSGTVRTIVHQTDYQDYKPNVGLYGMTVLVIGNYDTTLDYVSAMSGSYRYDRHHIWPESAVGRDVHYFYSDFPNGVSGNATFSNTPSDFKVLHINSDINMSAGSVVPAIVKYHGGGGTGGGVHVLMPVPLRQTIYSLLPDNAKFRHYPNDEKTGCPATGACPSYFISPLLSLSKTQNQRSMGFGPPMLPPFQENVFYNGLGPAFWNGTFQNSSTQINLNGYAGSSAFLRQDYALPQYDSIPYSVYKDNSLTTTGNIPASLPTRNTSGTSCAQAVNVTAAGNYELRLDYPYQVRAQNMLAHVSAKFNNGLADPNPPAIRRLYYFLNNARSEVYGSSGANRLEFEFDPAGGTISQAAAAYSSNGNSFTPLTVTSSAGVYSADIPALSGLSKITLRIDGTDSSGNSLSYTFELPAGQAIPPPESTPPTVSITAPANGATVSGTVSVTANASDNVGVFGVQFKVDGADIAAEDMSAPYSFGWTTTWFSSGPHTLTAVARDAAGNTTTSAGVTVTVNNSSSDTTPPSVSITAPTSGATLFGTVAIAAAASDNVGVKGVQFKRDGVNFENEDTSAPYGFSWNTSIFSPGLHTFTAVARDAAGNLATSAPVTVTIASSTADVTPPAATILSPSNGASVKQDVSVKISASDNLAVNRIDLWADGALAKTQTLSPAVPSATVSLAWRAATKGHHTLQAKAYDAAGNSGASSPVTVNVTGKINPVALVGAGGQALGDGSKTLLLSLQEAQGGAALAFSPDIAAAAVMDLKGRVIMRQSQQGRNPIVMSLRPSAGGGLPLESGLFIIRMNDIEGLPIFQTFLVVK